MAQRIRFVPFVRMEKASVPYLNKRKKVSNSIEHWPDIHESPCCFCMAWVPGGQKSMVMVAVKSCNLSKTTASRVASPWESHWIREHCGASILRAPTPPRGYKNVNPTFQ
ncbi:hypothetical protein CC1G_15437 [Coprinopsis cinerea okayama7|uniref:Uncharacterized protein n=1 Tax=Coprinopsis cinerea (strain Okayama-7 / 130 / ATCC MYA-4618 / FGSC 9003) TaxID=240176 RepID=D6RQP0_COPC7|nr:hypothetical protein CC1G_15437 [Coprinopsis cinerea okayama7\|eukprot:XP_002910160.1 hypothetical protein CC1G_15437 [Coprinopsis cinerea okayama7\